MTGQPRGAVREVVAVFLKLGLIAFGGPAAHIALMRDEIVRRRAWVSEPYFVDMLGVTNLIPGPNSTEMAIHLGLLRAGWPGLAVAGACFILPAAAITGAIAWAYVRYGTLPQVGWLLHGVKPVIIAIVFHALWSLGRTALRDVPLSAVATGVLALYLVGVNEIALLFGGGLVGLALEAARHRPWRTAVIAPLGLLGWPGTALAQTGAAVPASLGTLFLTFLKIGAVLYGSGYVLLAFLANDLVDRLGWLTEGQLLDAVAVGQFTPGPVFTTATFVGYLVGGWPGAALATLGIFLPSFVFVAAIHPLVPRLRRSRWAGLALDGVNAAAIGLMAGVTWELGRAAVVDPVTALLAAGAWALLVWTRLNSAWLVAGGGLAGIVTSVAGFGR